MTVKWITENVHPGTVLSFTGQFSGASSTPASNNLNLSFRGNVIFIRAKKGFLHTIATFDGRFTEKVLKLKPGTNLTIHGKVTVKPTAYNWGTPPSTLPILWQYTDKMGWYYVMAMHLTDCAFGKAPPPKKPTQLKPTSRPKRTDEDKARSKLALANSYISAGLKAKAVNVLKELITKYPKTNTATDAQAELEKLGKQ